MQPNIPYNCESGFANRWVFSEEFGYRDVQHNLSRFEVTSPATPKLYLRGILSKR